MYGYEWTSQNGVYRLSVNISVAKEIRPVFKEELDYFGLNTHWQYSAANEPLLWAEGIRRYILNGNCVAEAVGGNFYTKPVIKVFSDGLNLKPIDINALWQENERLMLGLEKTAMDFIRKTYEKYSRQGMTFAVAFSGGKDLLVLLDLVARTLSPDKFFVIFANTGMELSTTIQSVDTAKRHWQALKFFEAQSHFTPAETWEIFGPPGRRMRWCCSVHKSVPTILLLRELTGNHTVKAVIFDGVRAEESAQRAAYAEISVGAKNINQINCSLILKWGTAEIFLYLLRRKILFNDAYRRGLFRVGCTVCPMSSSWWEAITNDVYPAEMRNLLDKVESYARATKSKSEVKRFIEQGGWKARMGGRGLKNGGNRVVEKIVGDELTFSFVSQNQHWLDVCKLLGAIVKRDGDTCIQIIDGRQFKFTLGKNSVSYRPYSNMDRFIVKNLRGVANKVAYCVGCRACEVQCPAEAFKILDDGKIYIREENCIHCGNCTGFTAKGCLVAKSLTVTGGASDMDLKGMNRYQHFGFRRPWLEHFFEHKESCFTMGKLGNRQYDALKVWLRESGLIDSGLPTELFNRLEPLDANHLLTWAIIWTNLAYKSTIVKWYMLNATAGEIYGKSDLVYMLGEDYSKSTRDNAVTALFETFRNSPIGENLKQGIPIRQGNTYKYRRQGWISPEPAAILYALYKWAEETGRYAFTLGQMVAAEKSADVKAVSPLAIFGIKPDRFKDILQDLALNYDKYIRTTFVADLDNVQLFPAHKALDITNLIAR